jgi:hypothetical protein
MYLGEYYIAKGEWSELEELLGADYDVEKSYTLQNRGAYGLFAAEAAEEPSLSGGFLIQPAEVFNFKSEGGSKLYLRCLNNGVVVIQEG